MNTGSRAWTENATAGAVQVCILPDSTSVTLAPGSSVCYRNGRAFLRHRKVKLEGMAFFRVTKDAAHPFVVSSEGDSWDRELHLHGSVCTQRKSIFLENS